MLVVSRKNLLLPYIIIPLACVILVIDSYVFNYQWQSSLPVNPELWFWWGLLFGYPHIVASVMTYADKEYIHHYHHHLRRAALVVILMAVFIPAVWGMEVTFVIYAFYTAYHVLMQQYGIGLMLLKKRNMLSYRIFCYASLVVFFGIYLEIMFWEDYVDLFEGYYDWFAIPACVGLCASAVFYFRHIKDQNIDNIAQLYFLGNMVMIPLCFIFTHVGYSILSVIVPRIIHDITAYMVYITHDSNRNSQINHNIIYSILKKLHLNAFMITIIVSFSMGAIFHSFEDVFLPVQILGMAIVYFHYYMEGIMWKKGTPHREYVAFS